MNRSAFLSKAPQFIISLLIILFLLCGQNSIGKAFSQSSETLTPLKKMIIRFNEIEHFFVPVTMNQGTNITNEMSDFCGLDCVKWFWGGTNSLIVTMSRTSSDQAAQRAIQNIQDQFKGYKEAFYNIHSQDCRECGAPVLSWQIKHGKGSDDLVMVSTHGSVWIMMVLHVEGNPDNLFRDYCQGEQCWQDDIQEYGYHVLDLVRLQHRKLALNGYPPIEQNLEPITTMVPTPTPVNPPADALHKLDFLSSSPICALPCINNLEPGKSTIKEIPAFFASLGMDDIEPSSASIGACMDLSGIPGGNYYPYPPELCVYWKDDLVQFITIDLWNHPELLQMNRIANVLGTPERILELIMHGLGSGGRPNYSVALYYPEKHIMIETQGYAQKNSWNVCLSDRRKQTTRIIIYSEESKDEALKRFFDPEQSNWYDWTEELEISLPDLFTRMQDSERCIPYMK
ncbi:MAG: hypothetical protein CVU39_06315 [Chloroflexi bacterium HGW-Chloroflexi-10]|nr:MAG: hypothetical protein CVU39_06315 [Chloroflexi bacterium HGW-Chloroflexi-10]